jgi:ATP-dependent DNA ligase
MTSTPEFYKKGKSRKNTTRWPVVNLAETHKARWGEALTAGKMKRCVWVRPEVVAQPEFLAWTDADHLRHSEFVGLREDKDARAVVKEQSRPHSG